jgi:putative transposase
MDGHFHVWFATKGRKPALQGEIRESVLRHMKEISAHKNIRLVEIEALIDHVHLLLALEGTQTLSSVMHQLKGATARYIFAEYPELEFDLRHEALWQKGYGWRRVPPDQVRAVRQYIRTQDQRPHRNEY